MTREPMDNEPAAYLKPTQEAGREFFSREIEGEIVMLNLLRFREVADYSADPELAPPEPISGTDAYDLYMEHTLPFLRQSGGEVQFLGEGGPYLIGPPEARWDLAILVRHRSPRTFLEFASNDAYMAGMGHRRAGVQDSRLLPLVPRS